MGLVLAAPLAAAGALSSVFTAVCCCCSAVSCACTAASWASCCCRASLGRKTGVSPTMAKLFYIVILFLASILALILRFNSPSFDLGVLTTACSNGNVTVQAAGLSEGTYVYCKGEDAVYRISFVLALFYGAMALLSLVSEGAHRGYWALKVVVVAGAIAGCFFISSASFSTDAYAWVARIGAGIFLVLQILVLIDFAYTWNEDWVARAYAGALTEYSDAPQPKWLYAVLASAFALFGVTVAGVVLLYVYYASCGVGVAFTTIALLCVLSATALSLFRDKIVGVEGAILPVAVVSAYTTYLCWSALSSNPDATCVPGTQTALTIVIGAVIAAISLCWTTFSVTQNSAHLVQGEELEKSPEMELADQTAAGGAAAGVAPASAAGAPVTDVERGGGAHEEEGGEEEPWPSTEKPWTFHLIMVAASMFLCMLLTDWGTSQGGDLSTAGAASMWVKEAAQWVTSGVFVWTLVAPAVLRGREFT